MFWMQGLGVSKVGIPSYKKAVGCTERHPEKKDPKRQSRAV